MEPPYNQLVTEKGGGRNKGTVNIVEINGTSHYYIKIEMCVQILCVMHLGKMMLMWVIVEINTK